MARLATVGYIGDPATVGKSEIQAVGPGTAPTQEGTIVRTGDKYSLKITGLTSASRTGIGVRPSSSAPDGTDFYYRIPLRVATRPSAANQIFGVATTSTTTPATDMNLRLLSTGELEFRDNTTVLHTTAVLSLDTWYEVAVHWKRHATTPNAGQDTLELKLDGTTVYTSTTASIASAYQTLIVGGNLGAEAQNVGTWYFGPLAINDSNGSNETSWPSTTARVTYLWPTGTGTLNEPTPNTGANWECVDDLVADNTTTYAQMTTNSASWAAAGSRLLMTCQDASVGGIGASDTIAFVSIGVVWSSASAGTSAVAAGIRSNGSNFDCGSALTISTTTDSWLDDGPVAYTPQYVDPGTSVAWTVSGVDAMEIGARGSDTTPNAQVTQVYAIVEFTPAVGGTTSRRPPQRMRMGLAA